MTEPFPPPPWHRREIGHYGPSGAPSEPGFYPVISQNYSGAFYTNIVYCNGGEWLTHCKTQAYPHHKEIIAYGAVAETWYAASDWAKQNDPFPSHA